MVEMLMRKTVGALEPETMEGAEYLQKISLGTVVVASVRDPRRRSVRQHALFFAVLNKVWENQDYYKTAEALRHALLIKLGYVDHYAFKDGTAFAVPRSMSFAKMDAAEFSKLMDDALTFLTTEVIPGMNKDELLAEVEQMLGYSEVAPC